MRSKYFHKKRASLGFLKKLITDLLKGLPVCSARIKYINKGVRQVDIGFTSIMIMQYIPKCGHIIQKNQLRKSPGQCLTSREM